MKLISLETSLKPATKKKILDYSFNSLDTPLKNISSFNSFKIV